MAAIFAYRCSNCDEVHEGSPSFGFNEPLPYTWLSEDQKAAAHLGNDLCTIPGEEGTNYFVRAVLEVPIHGVDEPFTWGVWVSLSEKSYNRYVDTYDDPVEGDGFFGWVCNEIGLYPYDKTRAADVLVQLGGMRPKLRLHSGDNEDDPLVIDQQNGISVARAQQLAEQAMHPA